MRTKKFLSVLLAALLCVALLVPASASWQKTTVQYRFFFSRLIANPLLDMLPSLGDGVGLDLTGDLYTNSLVNDLLHEIVTAAGMFANVGQLSPFQAFFGHTNNQGQFIDGVFDQLSPSAQAHITQLTADGQIVANTTWATIISLDIDWGVKCRDTLIQYAPVPLRRFSSLVFRDDIRARWQSHYVPAFHALGVPDEYIADQETLNIAWNAAQNSEPAADDLLRSVFRAVLHFTEAMENDLLSFLMANLPNMVQNEAAINQLSAPLVTGQGFRPDGTSGGINTMVQGYWLNQDGSPRGGTFVGDTLLGFLEVDLNSGGFMTFFEDTLAYEFMEMGIAMPEIDWSLVYHAGDMIADQFVADEHLMGMLVLRYLTRISATPTNRPVLQRLIRDAIPGFQGILIAAIAPTALGLIFEL